MAHSYSAIYLHVVFSTRDRRTKIAQGKFDELYAYIGGIAKNLAFKLLCAAGTCDHLHLLISIPAKMSAATAIQKIKANASRFLGPTFAWQEGYGGFAVSASQVETVRNYIKRQEEHHRKHTFEEEFTALQHRHGLTRVSDGRVIADVVR